MLSAKQCTHVPALPHAQPLRAMCVCIFAASALVPINYVCVCLDAAVHDSCSERRMGVRALWRGTSLVRSPQPTRKHMPPAVGHMQPLSSTKILCNFSHVRLRAISPATRVHAWHVYCMLAVLLRGCKAEQPASLHRSVMPGTSNCMAWKSSLSGLWS